MLEPYVLEENLCSRLLDALDECAVSCHTGCLTGVEPSCPISSSIPARRSKAKKVYRLQTLQHAETDDTHGFASLAHHIQTTDIA